MNLKGRKSKDLTKSQIFIDATGDGNVAYFAGAEYIKGRKEDGAVQAMGTKVIIGGVETVSEEKRIKGYNLVKKAIDKKKLSIYHPFWKEVSEQGITLRENEVTPTATRVAR